MRSAPVLDTLPDAPRRSAARTSPCHAPSRSGIADEPASAPRVGLLVGASYRLTRFISEGGMGLVFAAENVVLRRPVAVKFMRPCFADDPKMVARFTREARVAASLQHPRLVDVFDVGWTADRLPFFVMELLEGVDLATEIERVGAMTASRAVALTSKVLDALAVAHDLNIVHRDLKPENVILVRRDGDEDVKVLDFGVSKTIGVSGQTEVGALLGTPWYMPPEQVQGARDVDFRADIYGAGAILYEMLAGAPPYGAGSVREILARIACEDPPPIESLRPGLPSGLSAVVRRALEREPDARWPSARAMAAALATVIARHDRRTELATIEYRDDDDETDATDVWTSRPRTRRHGWASRLALYLSGVR